MTIHFFLFYFDIIRKGIFFRRRKSIQVNFIEKGKEEYDLQKDTSFSI